MTGKPIEAKEQPYKGIDTNTSYREYEMMDAHIHENVSSKYFCELKHTYDQWEGNRGTQIP